MGDVFNGPPDLTREASRAPSASPAPEFSRLPLATAPPPLTRQHVSPPPAPSAPAVPSVVPQPPPTFSRAPDLSRQALNASPAPSAPYRVSTALPLAHVPEGAEVTPPPDQASSPLASPTPTPKRASPPRSVSSNDQLDDSDVQDEDPRRRSERQRSAVPAPVTAAPDLVPRPTVKRGRAGSKKPKAG